ncbi:hypothetical protein OPV22_031132 [Ensete ventricosum]|uniref:QWRF motif-containing protein 2 n=1 Tax=Ensete ventricosum TaxID=4639 RepID=A0AAV8PKA4_ENSVE|nr:hypothetical protein OPV22_031132 [Ensete ventricosum]
MEKRTPRRTKSRELTSYSSSSSSSLSRRSADSSSSSLASVVVWPSASAATEKSLCLADHLSDDRLSDLSAEPKRNGGRRASCNASPQSTMLGRQRSYSGECSSRFKQEEKDKMTKNMRHNMKESSRPILGGSMRYIGEVIRFPPSLTPASSLPSSVLNSRSGVLHGKPRLERVVNLPNHDELRRPVRSSSSWTAYELSRALWSPSPAKRSVSPPVVSADKGKSRSFTSSGLDLLRRKWQGSSSDTTKSKKGKVAHQLQLTWNRLIQWRWVNAELDEVGLIKRTHAEVKVLGAWVGLSNLRTRVARKRMQLENDRLHLKLMPLLSSQLKILEDSSEMERQHTAALSAINDCLQAAVCRLPLADGAKVDLQLLLAALTSSTDYALTTRTTISRLAHTLPTYWVMAIECAEDGRIAAGAQAGGQQRRSSSARMFRFAGSHVFSAYSGAKPEVPSDPIALRTKLVASDR